MTETMRMGVTHLAELAMMPEQRAKAGRGHGLTTLSALQGDEQSGRIGQRPFQAQIVSEDFKNFWGQRHDALLVAFTNQAHLAVAELQVFQLKSQDLAGAQTVEEH